MSAIGELLIYIIYIILGFLFLVFLILGLLSKTTKRTFFNICIFFGFVLIVFKSCQYNSYLNNQNNQVGIYYLTNYPNCDSCYLELKENMTYIIVKDGENIRNGTWHHESGGDYWITYLDGKKHQLGSGDYSYTNYKLKNKP